MPQYSTKNVDNPSQKDQSQFCNVEKTYQKDEENCACHHWRVLHTLSTLMHEDANSIEHPGNIDDIVN